jgi:hypothetical protein
MEELTEALSKLSTQNPREAAEYAFAMATLALQDGDADMAAKYAKTSVELFERSHTDTLEDCAPINAEIAGVIIPDIIHEGVVRARFGL